MYHEFMSMVSLASVLYNFEIDPVVNDDSPSISDLI